VSIEIERKFLITSEVWRQAVVRTKRIVDGLLMASDGCKLRVRLYDGQATLTFKGRRSGLAREEVDLPLDLDQAQSLLDHHCLGRVLSKSRHLVPQGELIWEIDEFDAPLKGIVLAEIELPEVDHALAMPSWIGEEVTGDPNWSKFKMLEARLPRESECPLPLWVRRYLSGRDGLRHMSRPEFHQSAIYSDEIACQMG
jgi:adenylate cyclase